MSGAADFQRVWHDVMRRYRRGDYADALTIAERAAREFPDQSHETYWARICLTSRLGRREDAVRLLDEALARGHWYNQRQLRGDSDLAPLQGLPEFERLVEVSLQRWSAAQGEAKPGVVLVEPRAGSEPYPLLLAVHGNNSSAEAEAARWDSAAGEGWLVALPQSSQVFSSRPGSFGWNDRERAVREIREQFASLQRRSRVDASRVVLGGFSVGAQLAVWLAMSGRIPARGVIAVAPYLPVVDNWLPFLQRAQARGLRVYLVVGADDVGSVDDARALSSLLGQANVAVQLSLRPGLGHEYPADFAAELRRALEFALAPLPA